MNIRMWGRALQTIPRISKEEWDQLDVVSKWLITTRAAVLIMTFISAAIAGLLAARAGHFDMLRWVLVAFGLVFAHATNNILNDLTDYKRGVDKDNYFRTVYGPQPIQQGLMSEREVYTYAAVTGLIALACGIALVAMTGTLTLILLAAGAFFVLFYTWPLKYIGLGELAVLVVWGPLMIGGGYYVITGQWDWTVALASLPYALGTVTVIFGKHIDKLKEDKAKHIRTLPVLIGETTGRYAVLAMIALMYLSVIYLVIVGYFAPVMLVVLLALVSLRRVLPIFLSPRPTECPPGYDPKVWPLYFVALAFYHNRIYGLLFLVGLILQLLIH